MGSSGSLLRRRVTRGVCNEEIPPDHNVWCEPNPSFLLSGSMVRTERQALTDMLLYTFMATYLAESAATADSYLLSDSDTSNSTTSGDSDSGSEEDPPPTSLSLLSAISYLHSKRYLNERLRITKSRAQLSLCLDVWKTERPKIFRTLLRVHPDTFDELVARLQDDEVFHNDSQNEQFPVAEQVAVALWRFGHFGNAASLLECSLWCGWGYGTVDLCTKRVVAAVCRSSFRRAVIKWPDAVEKEKAKQWVEEMSCPDWRNGWLMVDGTLVPLASRPGFFGNTWFDRKSNYSMNAQIICTPDLIICDYGVGLPGSQHDSTAWKETRLPTEHEALLDPGEWIWADSAYPLQVWLCAPYKRPENEDRLNARFNYYLSVIRVRSEHCMGFLKGRFSSLRGLRIHINKASDIAFASFWITACIVLHTFAAVHERGDDMSSNEFYLLGLQIIATEKRDTRRRREEAATRMAEDERAREAVRDLELLQGKIKREELKKDLFAYLDRN